MNPTRLEFIEGSSSKFWVVSSEGPTLTVRYGRIGTDGVPLVKKFSSPAAAEAEAQKLLAAKLKKGYTTKGGAGKSGAGKTVKAGEAFPFVGHGPNVDEKCLECYLWLETPPAKSVRSSITQTIPLPLQSFAHWDGELLHFGSDDSLEARVRAAYAKDAKGKTFEDKVERFERDAEKRDSTCEPTAAEWRAFSDALATWAHAVHAVSPVRLLLRPTRAAEKPTGWHRASLGMAVEVLRRNLPPKKKRTPHRNALTWLVTLLVQALCEEYRFTPADRAVIADWADQLLPTAPDPIASELADHLQSILDAAPEKERKMLLARLRTDARERVGSKGEIENALARGDAKALSRLCERPDTLELLSHRVDLDQEAHAKAFAGAIDHLIRLSDPPILLVGTVVHALSDAGEKGLRKLQSAVSLWARRQDQGTEISGPALDLARAGRFSEAIAIFEALIKVPDQAGLLYQNALWVAQAGNNKLPVDRARLLRFLRICVPHGTDNPGIFYNAACAYMELGDRDAAIEHVRLALAGDYPKREEMRADASFKPLAKDSRFVALFDPDAYRGVKLPLKLKKEIEAAQQVRTYTIGGDPCSRTRAEGSCKECHVFVGQFHQVGCAVERCPACGKQAISCGHVKKKAPVGAS